MSLQINSQGCGTSPATGNFRRMSFQKIWALWEPKVDLFASAWNRQLDLFVSWKPQPEAMAVDAFSINWINLEGYAFPPFNMISRYLTKIRKEAADLILVAPVWQAQPWWPAIMELACQPPRVIHPELTMLLDPLGNSHPLLARGSLLLAVWSLSGTASKPEAFRTISGPASRGRNRDATSACYQSSWNGWLSWCAKRGKNPLSTASSNIILDFLADLYREGKAYRSINVFRSMLSSTLD